MKTKCFFSDCKKKANERGKFCTHHDKLEREACAEMSAIFDRAEKKEGYSV